MVFFAKHQLARGVIDWAMRRIRNISGGDDASPKKLYSDK